MKPINILTLLIALAALGLASLAVYNHKKVFFIDTNLVFVGFKMTIEQDEQIKKIEEKKQTVLDSLMGQLKNIQAGLVKIEPQQIELLKKNYVNKSAKFNDEIKILKQSTMDKIWKQINQYISEYAKEKNIDIILGANGQGSLMYAKENTNISEEVIKYINEKYSGTK